MRRSFMRQHGVRQTALHIGEALGQCGAEPVEFINLRMLLDDGLIQYIEQIFLMRELALQRNQSVFSVLCKMWVFISAHERVYCQ